MEATNTYAWKEFIWYPPMGLDVLDGEGDLKIDATCSARSLGWPMHEAQYPMAFDVAVVDGINRRFRAERLTTLRGRLVQVYVNDVIDYRGKYLKSVRIAVQCD